MRLAVLSATLVFAAGAAGAAWAQTPAQPTPAAAKPAADKQICKSQTKEGSRMKTKICMTKAEWDYLSDETRRQFSETQNRAQTPHGGN